LLTGRQSRVISDVVAAFRTRLACALVAAFALGGVAIGCAEDPHDAARVTPAEAAIVDGPTSGQLGRIHVVLQPQPDEIEPEPQLQISGRFVEYRGVTEDFVRARTNLPVPVWEQLVPGQCVASEQLLPTTTGPRDVDDRELSMIDAGDLRVVLGNREFVPPLALIPDLLPWLSGVEYTHVDDRIPALGLEPDGTSPVVVSVDGSSDGSLEGFTSSVVVPVPLVLETAKASGGTLTIDWHPPGDTGQTIVLRLQAFIANDGVSEPAGEEVTCLVADTGRADLALAPLANAGLTAGLGVEPPDSRQADLLRVSASRFDVAQVSAGNFGLVDVFVELRAQKTLPLL
jgi:hypothetical protein